MHYRLPAKLFCYPLWMTLTKLMILVKTETKERISSATMDPVQKLMLLHHLQHPSMHHLFVPSYSLDTHNGLIATKQGICLPYCRWCSFRNSRGGRRMHVYDRRREKRKKNGENKKGGMKLSADLRRTTRRHRQFIAIMMLFLSKDAVMDRRMILEAIKILISTGI